MANAAIAPTLKAVIWDMDGTLLDTETTSTQAINLVLQRFGHCCDADTKREITGTRRDFWTNLMIDRYGLTGQLSPDQLGDEWEKNMTLLSPTAQKMPGIETLTAAVSAAGIPQGIATSSRRASEKLASHAGLAARMQVIVTGDMVSRSKPAPDIFLLVAEKLGVRPEECIVFEDSPLGIAGAVAAGMTAVAVPDRSINIPTASFQAAGAHLILESLEGADVDTFVQLLQTKTSGTVPSTS